MPRPATAYAFYSKKESVFLFIMTGNIVSVHVNGNLKIGSLSLLEEYILFWVQLLQKQLKIKLAA